MSDAPEARPRHPARRWHPRRLGKALAATSALASALSVLLGFLAARVAPHGVLRVAVMLHLRREPFIVKLAATVAAVAVTTAALAGLFHFYNWWQERDADAD